MSRRVARDAKQHRAMIWERTLTALTYIMAGTIIALTITGIGFGLRLAFNFATN